MIHKLFQSNILRAIVVVSLLVYAVTAYAGVSNFDGIVAGDSVNTPIVTATTTLNVTRMITGDSLSAPTVTASTVVNAKRVIVTDSISVPTATISTILRPKRIVTTDSASAPVLTASTQLNAATAVLTDSLVVAGEKHVNTITLNLDSLGYDSETNVAVFTPWRDYTLIGLEVTTATALATDTGLVYLTSRGADADTLFTDSLLVQGSGTYFSDFSGLAGAGGTGTARLSAAQPCSVWVNDGGLDGSGDGGHGAGATVILTVQDR